MQATAASTQVSSEQVAEEILGLLTFLMKGTAPQFFGILEELDLSLTQMKTLQMLGGCNEELSVKELSAAIGLSLPGASRTVDGLLKRGFIERREDDDDRRMKRLRITPEGQRVVDTLNTARLAGIAEYASTFSDEQRAALHAALTALPHKQ